MLIILVRDSQSLEQGSACIRCDHSDVMVGLVAGLLNHVYSLSVPHHGAKQQLHRVVGGMFTSSEGQEQ
jgi:hypothetical protein